jgi:hypothetical protein
MRKRRRLVTADGQRTIVVRITPSSRQPADAIFELFWQLNCLLVAMSVVDRKQELFENIVRLRRVGRGLPGSADVCAVRGALESELGETALRAASPGDAALTGSRHLSAA